MQASTPGISYLPGERPRKLPTASVPGSSPRAPGRGPLPSSHRQAPGASRPRRCRGPIILGPSAPPCELTLLVNTLLPLAHNQAEPPQSPASRFLLLVRITLLGRVIPTACWRCLACPSPLSGLLQSDPWPASHRAFPCRALCGPGTPRPRAPPAASPWPPGSSQFPSATQLLFLLPAVLLSAFSILVFGFILYTQLSLGAPRPILFRREDLFPG